MPNWCNNHLQAKGEVTALLDFIEDTHEVNKETGFYELSFEKINPTPLNENGEVFDELYSWRNSNWGTKWDADVEYEYMSSNICDGASIRLSNENVYNKAKQKGLITEENINNLRKFVNVDNCEGTYGSKFNTAWAPPKGIYNTIRERYNEDDLEFEASYYEGGCGFAGELKWTKGEITESKYVECCGDGIVDYYEYLLEEGHEDEDYYLDEITSKIAEDHPDEWEEIVQRVSEEFCKADNKGKATMFCDVVISSFKL